MQALGGPPQLALQAGLRRKHRSMDDLRTSLNAMEMVLTAAESRAGGGTACKPRVTTRISEESRTLCAACSGRVRMLIV